MARSSQKAARKEIVVDKITEDPKNNEFALYLLEDGPWPRTEDDWEPVLKRIQERILDTADAAIDGGVAAKFPDTRGRNIRVQVDSPSGLPKELERLITNIRRYLASNPEYAEAISDSPHIGTLRLVTGAEMGRFMTPKGVA